jgi:hypothetical protein
MKSRLWKKVRCIVLGSRDLTFILGLASILRPACGDTAPQTGWKGAGEYDHY